MIVKIPNQSLDLSIELFDRKAPLACRFLQQQLAASAWSNASLHTVTDQAVLLGSATPQSLKLAKQRPPRFATKGLVAYSKNSDTEIVIHRSHGPIEVGPLIGKLTEKSLAQLDSYLQGDRSRAGAPKRRKTTYNSEGPDRLDEQQSPPQSSQLREILQFQKRLESWRKSHASPRTEV